VSEPGSLIQLRDMEAADIPQVVAIDRQSFPLPWSEATYRRELHDNLNSHFMVAVRGPAPGRPAGALQGLLRREARPRVVGYIGFWYIVDEAHISTLAVHPDYRRQGVGRLLLQAMLAKAAALGAHLATLEVRVSNLEAQQLYARYGFVEVGLRKGYYRDNREDALLMTLAPLGAQPAPQGPNRR
jgi:ribosomal-protein-alanine N-acetyltransferase